MTERRWRVVIASPAARDIDRLPMKVATAAIEAIKTIASDPRRLGKPLRLELSGQWTARRGPYRLIYTIDDETSTITITAVAHRADVYRSIGRPLISAVACTTQDRMLLHYASHRLDGDPR